MAQVEVKSSDVIKLILQYLQESNLVQSFLTLQRQSKVTLNTTDTQSFISSVHAHRWDQLLGTLNSLMLSEQHLFNTYELILDDLIENDRYQAAEFIIKNWLQKHIKNMVNYRERLLRIEHIIENPQEKAIHKKVVSRQREDEVIRQCLHDMHSDVQPHRLITLLTQAIKLQSQQGEIKPSVKLDLFEGRQKAVVEEQQTIIKTIEKVVKYEEQAKIESLALSWGEQYLALGGSDGLIQIYSTIDYSYHTRLKFQAEGTALFHDYPVTLMQFNHNDTMLASVDKKSVVKLWNLETGRLLRKIEGERQISCVAWGMDPSHIVIGSVDLKLYGIRSCVVLKQYLLNSQGDYLNTIFISDGRIYAVTNGGIVKIFNYNTQQELVTTNLKSTVVAVVPLYQSRGSQSIDRILVGCVGRVHELSRGGEEEARRNLENGQLIAMSCTGEYLYEFTLSEGKHRLNVVARSSGKVVYFCGVEGATQLTAQQRRKNLIVSYDDQHSLNFWRQPN